MNAALQDALCQPASNGKPANSKTENGCLACGATMSAIHVPWAHRCPNCGLLHSELWDETRWARKESVLDETYRFDAIKQLRQQNANTILDKITAHLRGPARPYQLCDVGCGYGWFGEVAAKRGFAVTGIEPEPRIADAARKEGATVVTGCFPECLLQEQQFDVITFNDVLEHIPPVKQCLAACATHLRKGGLLAIAIPSANGFFYRVATLLSRFGIHGPFDRMWQRSFHSPHIHYVTSETLTTLVTPHGFRKVYEGTLPTLTRSGLWSRLVMDGSQSRLVAAGMWIALSILIPLLARLPADIIFHLYERE